MNALLQLLRVPNVFTAMANVAAGVFLARGGRLAVVDLFLLAASACLYLSGMALNDYFDREIDALERPERPIPSGRIPAGVALAIGAGLMAAGVLLAAWHSSVSAAVAAALACAILLYDGALKGGPFGPVAMGMCRFLNVCLGLSVAEVAPPAAWMWIAPVTMGVYTFAITGLSQGEVGGGEQTAVRRQVIQLVATLAAALFALVVLGPADHGYSLALWPLAGYVAFRSHQLFGPLWSSPAGPDIGRAIGGGILLMPYIDACMVAAAGYPVAAAWVASLSLPALLLKRYFYMT